VYNLCIGGCSNCKSNWLTKVKIYYIIMVLTMFGMILLLLTVNHLYLCLHKDW
jgi:hypothetical protein